LVCFKINIPKSMSDQNSASVPPKKEKKIKLT